MAKKNFIYHTPKNVCFFSNLKVLNLKNQGLARILSILTKLFVYM